jgi:hypothetical protein
MKNSVAVYMMQKNEIDLLPLFISYYGYLFGYKSLYIFDNGSDEYMASILENAIELGCSVNFDYKSPKDFENKGAIIGDHINKNINEFDIALPLDCDEFIVLEGINNRFIDKSLFNEYFSSLENGAHFVANRYLNNPYKKNKFYKPTKNSKLFFKGCKVKIKDVGFHKADLPFGTSIFKDGALAYFEFHNRSYHELIERSQEKMKLRLDLNELPNNYNGIGYHLYEYLKWKGEEDYIESIFKNQQFEFNGIELILKKLGKNLPFIEEGSNNDFELFNGDDILFKKLIKESENYCEYGCGRSTVWAAFNSKANIVSLDTSKEWRDSVSMEVAEVNEKIKIFWVDCGPVKEWGHPVTLDLKERFIEYAMNPWLRDDKYDLVLIDGRFRVLCFLISLKNSRPGTRILFDDYTNRSSYHIIEKIINRSSTCGRQCLFITPELSKPQISLIDQMIEEYKYVAL